MATTTTTALMHSVKILLMSTGVVFIAILLTPQLASFFTAAELPSIWTSLRSWLRPPYLYVIINGIIITIAASNRLLQQHKHQIAESHAADGHDFHHIHHNDHYRSSAAAIGAYAFGERQILPSDPAPVADIHPLPTPIRNPPPAVAQFVESYGAAVKDLAPIQKPPPAVAQFVESYGTAVKDLAPAEVMYNESLALDELIEEEKEMVVKEDPPLKAGKYGFAVNGDSKESRSVTWRSAQTTKLPPPVPAPAPLARQETSDMVSSFFQSQIQKPPPSARFGSHRRPTRTTPEGKKALRVAKPKRNETLESTWKTITEGRHMPLTRHMKKSDTFENHSREAAASDPVTPSPVKKSETFSNRSVHSPAPTAAAAKLKKEPSLGQEELNRRVEAFISKFNEDMRLQRQESMQQFQEMINRAAY